MVNAYLPKSIILLFIISLMFSLPTYATTKEQSDGISVEDVQRFSNALSQIKHYYVKPTNDKELFDNAIRGMLSGLDPHSTYLNEEDFRDLKAATDGEFGGLGIEVTMENGVVKVVTPLVDSPAYKAGIKAGDYIVKLGQKSLQGLELREAVNLMRGKAGTPIELTIFRKGEKKPLSYKLTREKIVIQSVKSKLLDKKYGYVRLTQFQSLTGKDMVQAIEQLKKEAGGNLKGLVLDLRNNPGGLLDAAIQVSDAFIHNNNSGKEEIIVYTEGRLPGSKFTAVAHPGDILANAPLVVLINNGSASASEIVAGALQDHKRAIILGTKTFGKGSVQTVLPLDDKRGIKLTTALYYTPSGRSIQAQGIQPDITVSEILIPKKDGEEAFVGFSEADLKGHLLNAQKKSTEEQVKSHASIVDENNLIHEDYQLYSALTVLKGLAIAKR